MALYPPTRTGLRTRLAGAQYLSQLGNDTLDSALDQARAEVELACPSAADGTLSTRLDRAAWSIAMDLAVWYLRFDRERDEEGAPPKALLQVREVIDERLERLVEAVAYEDSAMTFEPYEALDPVPLPADVP